MNMIVLALLIIVMLICVWTDLKERRIYNVVTLSAIGIIILIRIFHHPEGLPMYAGGILPAFLLYAAAVVTKGSAVGGGDILLVLFIGLTIGGIGTVMTLVYTFALGLIYMAVMFIFTRRVTSVVPMAPFLAGGLLLYFTQSQWLAPLVLS